MTDDQHGDQVADFDAFFAEQAPARRTGPALRLFGREYRLPGSLPVMFTLQLQRVQDSSDPDDMRRLLAILFGPDAVDDWAAHGMSDEQLGIVIVWATANTAAPGSVSMAEAARLYAEQEAAKEGKAAAAPTRAARRANAHKGKARRGSSGRR